MGRFPPIHPDRCYVYIIIKFIYKYIIYNMRARVETYGPYVRRPMGCVKVSSKVVR